MDAGNLWPKTVLTMLISFSVENYRSFADEQTLSLEATKDDAHPDHVVDCGKFSLLKSIAVYGSNSSGKSNLLRAIGFMANFVRASATEMNLGDPIRSASRFHLDRSWAAMPCSFDVRLLLSGTEYQYGFSVTRERVYDEWLFVKRKDKKASNPLSRRFDPGTEKTDWNLRGELKGQRELIEKTRDNGLFLSRAAEMNVDFVKGLYYCFGERISYLDLAEMPSWLTSQTIRRVATDDLFRQRVESMIHDADFGIDGLSIIQSDGLHKGDTFFDLKTIHKVRDSDDMIGFRFERDESNGTQRFFGVIGPVLDAIDNGSVLVVDELDCSMHPHLTRKLVEMFHSKELNPKGAQLIFATHDTNLMSPALFRRDQIWITEKASNGGTELFSLSDIESKNRPRKEEPFEKHYLAGRYGGVPSFGPALEDL